MCYNLSMLYVYINQITMLDAQEKLENHKYLNFCASNQLVKT